MITTSHIIILLVVVLLVFGTSKLRNIGSDLGSAIKGFKKSMEDSESKEVQPLQSLDKKDADFHSTSQSSKTENKSSNS